MRSSRRWWRKRGASIRRRSQRSGPGTGPSTARKFASWARYSSGWAGEEGRGNWNEASLPGGVFLPKLAKHLALVACLMIVSQVAGRPVVGQLGIFVTVVLAALLHSAGRTVRRRLTPFLPL